MKQININISQMSRRDQLFDAYMNAATAAGVEWRPAKDAFDRAYAASKQFAYPKKLSEKTSTAEEREAYAKECAHPTTKTDKARVLDALMQKNIDRPEWLASALLKPRKPKGEAREVLLASIARIKRRIGVLEQAEQRLKDSRVELFRVESKMKELS